MSPSIVSDAPGVRVTCAAVAEIVGDAFGQGTQVEPLGGGGKQADRLGHAPRQRPSDRCRHCHRYEEPQDDPHPPRSRRAAGGPDNAPCVRPGFQRYRKSEQPGVERETPRRPTNLNR
jgi:hypothetical protein